MSRLLWWLPGLVACGSYANAFTASEAVAVERCERAFACQSTYPADAEVPFASLWGEDAEACASTLGPDPAFANAWKSAEKDGLLRYDKGAAKVCVDTLALQSCDEFWAQTDPESCALTTSGTVAVDGACTIDAMCESGLCDGGRCIGQPQED